METQKENEYMLKTTNEDLSEQITQLQLETQNQLRHISSKQTFTTIAVIIAITLICFCFNEIITLKDGCDGQTQQSSTNKLPDIFKNRDSSADKISVEKPVIYIYPEKDNTPVHIDIVTRKEKVTATWPKAKKQDNIYNWQLTAFKDGTLLDENGRTYSSIFWEGEYDIDSDFSEGFCVKGKDTADFLAETLKKIGLTDTEANEMITYWLPRMKESRYNLITFKGINDESPYNGDFGLNVISDDGKAPESIMRLLMVWKPIEEEMTIKEQTFTTFERKGFTVIEWGGYKAE